MRKPLTVAAFLTAVWLLVALWLGWSAHTPQDCAAESGTFSCLAANEWGDYLAGVFAPVAFLWLAAAVFIQSQELSAQRIELQLSRQEMSQQREVMRAQTEEAKKQAEFIGTQTDILLQQQLERQHETNLRDFEATITEISDTIRQKFYMNGPILHIPSDARNVNFTYKAEDRDGWISSFYHQLYAVPDGARAVIPTEKKPDFLVIKLLAQRGCRFAAKVQRDHVAVRLGLYQLVDAIEQREEDTRIVRGTTDTLDEASGVHGPSQPESK